MTEIHHMNLDRSHITTPQAAKRSGLTKGYITFLLRNGDLDGFRYGGAKEWFVYVDSLEQFLAKPRKPGPKGPRKNASNDFEAATSAGMKKNISEETNSESVPLIE